MSCNVNPLAVYVKVYLLPLVKVGTDLAITVLVQRQEEVFWFRFSSDEK